MDLLRICGAASYLIPDKTTNVSANIEINSDSVLYIWGCIISYIDFSKSKVSITELVSNSINAVVKFGEISIITVNENP